MIKTIYYTLGILAALALLAGAGVLFSKVQPAEGQGLSGGVNASDCTMSTSTLRVVNPQSTTILSAHSRRAWASVQQPRNATNTIAINLGGTAVVGDGFQLFDIATSTGEASRIEFGLNTPLPYTGDVNAIASAGTTTILVTECRY